MILRYAYLRQHPHVFKVMTGLTVSYYANLPPGGTIVLTATGLFLVAAGLETVRGRL